jgi:ribosomal protein L39E
MKKFLTAIGLSLTLTLPAIASSLAPKQPTVRPYSLEAMGCMILLECTEGIEKLSAESEFLKNQDFDPFREEIIRIVTALNKLEVPVYVAPERYFTPRTVGLYKPNYNRFFINETLLKDPREFLGTLRHEGWHVVQDCMGGGLKTSFMAQVHQDSEIPAWIMKQTRLTYESMMQSRAIPWEADANWAEEQLNQTARHLDMCVQGPLWDQIRPTPMTMDWLIGCGYMKPQEGKYPYYPNKKVEYCTEGKY